MVNHPSYDEERDKLDATMELIDKQVVNLRNAIRPTEDFAEQKVNEVRAQTATRLERVRGNPYFGRIQFEPKEGGKKEDGYIGKHGIYDEETLEPVVIDWRAPLASLFYNSSGDESFYIADGRRVTGNLTLKRSYKIEDGDLLDIYDHSSETIADEFLLQALSEKGEAKMSDIVSTIQKEQNRIIREDRRKVVVVQGVAGSGKTSVALHRLAFLLYEYQEAMKANHVAIIGPNRMFIDYIKDVLPELGVDDVRQLTLQELFQDFLGDTVKVKSDDTGGSDAWIHRVKGTMAYRKYVEWWIASYETSALDQFVDGRFERTYTFEGRSIPLSVPVSAAELRGLYERRYKSMPIFPRLQAIKKHLGNQLLSSIVQSLHKQRIDLNRESLEHISQETTAFAKDFMPIEHFDIHRAYRRAFTNKTAMEKILLEQLTADQVKTLCEHNARFSNSGQYQEADLPALFVLSDRLFGNVKKKLFDHLVIDEAQDIGPFAFSVLRDLASQQSLTILGDLAQAIYADRGFRRWDELIGPVFDQARTEFFELRQSYRSTVQIMELANDILRPFDRFGQVVPIVRTGATPEVHVFDTAEVAARKMVGEVEEGRAAGYATIAIVAKSEQECTEWHAELVKAGMADLLWIQGENVQLKKGTLLVPVTMAKGLEFDAVIVPNACEARYTESEEDAKRLYVAVTRALHRLAVYSVGPITPLLKTRV